MVALANIPQSRIADASGRVTPEWLQYFLNPQVQQISIAGGVAVTSGGTGLITVPAIGQLLVGNGVGYTLTSTLPTSAFPALTGDITTPGGSLVTTLPTVNSTPGIFGSGTVVPVYTVNGKGLIVASANANITGSPGAFQAVGAFGCNTKAAQTSATANAAIASTAGAAYTGTEQTMLNDLKALVNQIRAALVADGIMV